MLGWMSRGAVDARTVEQVAADSRQVEGLVHASRVGVSSSAQVVVAVEVMTLQARLPPVVVKERRVARLERVSLDDGVVVAAAAQLRRRGESGPVVFAMAPGAVVHAVGRLRLREARLTEIRQRVAVIGTVVARDASRIVDRLHADRRRCLTQSQEVARSCLYLLAKGAGRRHVATFAPQLFVSWRRGACGLDPLAIGQCERPDQRQTERGTEQVSAAARRVMPDRPHAVPPRNSKIMTTCQTDSAVTTIETVTCTGSHSLA